MALPRYTLACFVVAGACATPAAPLPSTPSVASVAPVSAPIVDADVDDVPDGTYLPPPPRAAPGSRGFLSVLCLPGCSVVFVDDQPLGPSPIFKHPIPVGMHKVKLVSDDPTVTRIVETVLRGDSVTTIREVMSEPPR